MTFFEKIKVGGRIVFLLVVGTVLIFGAREAIELYQSFYEQEEDITLLTSDFTVAQYSSSSSRKKLKELNNKYAKLLKKYNSNISAYSELYATYTNTVQELKELQSQIPDSTTDTVPCSENGQCTREICLPLFIGEKLHYTHEDYHMALDLKMERLNGYQWESVMNYRLHQLFKLTLVELSHKETGERSLQASLFEIDADGNELRPLEITKFSFSSENNTQFGMTWWSPTIKLGIHQPVFTRTTWFPKGFLAIAFSKWGRPGFVDLWHFFQIGVGVETDGALFLLASPASYNIGSVIPLVSDLWLGIDIGVDIKKQSSVGISISTTL